MADIWQQFHSLPKAIRDGVSTQQAIAAIDAIERQFPHLDLATFVMRAVVREFPVSALEAQLQHDTAIDAPSAAAVAERLRREVFVGDIADYLGMTKAPATAPSTKAPLAAAPPVAPPPANLPIGQTPAPVINDVPRPPTVPTMRPNSPIGLIAPTTHYSEEDANEIARNIEHLKVMTVTPANQDLDTIARRILSEQSLAFGDELLDRRAVSIIKARLKDIRTTDETRTILMHEPKVGGLGLDPEIAKQVAAAAERLADQLKTEGKVLPPAAPAAPALPAVPKVTQEHPTPLPPFTRAAVPTPPPVIPNVTDRPMPSRPIVRPADIPLPPMTMTNSPPPIARPAPPPPPTAPPMIQGSRGTDRKTVTDVVRPSKLLGPAEELRSMSLMEFRRLGQGATDSARRLYDKFQHFQHESFTVWSQAINGWRQSDVYQLYLDMGRESLERAVPISQIIADRGKSGQPYLSEHEFTVISDLNRQLQL